MPPDWPGLHHGIEIEIALVRMSRYFSNILKWSNLQRFITVVVFLFVIFFD
jgi:hypothetical protein